MAVRWRWGSLVSFFFLVFSSFRIRKKKKSKKPKEEEEPTTTQTSVRSMRKECHNEPSQCKNYGVAHPRARARHPSPTPHRWNLRSGHPMVREGSLSQESNGP